MPQTAYLFLDFDGVTHPWGGVEDFRCLPLIEDVIREFEEARIVVTSDWRTLFSLHKLTARFSEDIRERVVGTTPHLPPKRGPELHGLREREARQWLTQRQELSAPWIAIDDAPGNWLTRSRLVLTDFKRGFTEEDGDHARRLLLSFRDGSFLDRPTLSSPALWAAGGFSQ